MRRTKIVLTAALLITPLALAGCAPEADLEEETAAADVAETEPLEPVPVDAEPVTTVTAWDWDWDLHDALDADGDAMLTEAEFEEGFIGAYGTWDTDADATLTFDELETATYDWWDVDDDELIDRNEWTAVTTDWKFDSYTWNEWGTYDADGDGYLGTTEFQELFDEEAWQGVWDADGDGVVGRDEMADTFWDLFDGNDDDRIDANEWEAWTS